MNTNNVNKHPSNFTSHPFDSVLKKHEAEQIAKNIMIILARTGNGWRKLSKSEYEQERKKDGCFTTSELNYFDQVIDYTVSELTAKLFCKSWAS